LPALTRHSNNPSIIIHPTCWLEPSMSQAEKIAFFS